MRVVPLEIPDDCSWIREERGLEVFAAFGPASYREDAQLTTLNSLQDRFGSVCTRVWCFQSFSMSRDLGTKLTVVLGNLETRYLGFILFFNRGKLIHKKIVCITILLSIHFFFFKWIFKWEKKIVEIILF